MFFCCCRFPEFERARDWVVQQHISTRFEWDLLVQSGALPDYVKGKPYYEYPNGYKNKGWVSWPHWYGLDTLPDTDGLDTLSDTDDQLAALADAADLAAKRERERVKKQRQRASKRAKGNVEEPTEHPQPVGEAPSANPLAPTTLVAPTQPTLVPTVSPPLSSNSSHLAPPGPGPSGSGSRPRRSSVQAQPVVALKERMPRLWHMWWSIPHRQKTNLVI
jgi:hypothetical protein